MILVQKLSKSMHVKRSSKFAENEPGVLMQQVKLSHLILECSGSIMGFWGLRYSFLLLAWATVDDDLNNGLLPLKKET